MRFTGTTDSHLGLLEKIRDHATVANSVSTPAATGTGNGLISYPVAENDAPSETWTLTCTATAVDGGTFSVVGSVSGAKAVTYVGTAYDNDIVAFTISDGSTDFIVGDVFEFVVTQLIGENVWEEMRYRNLVDVTTAEGYTGEFDYSAGAANARAFVLNPEGTKLFILDTNKSVYSYTLSRAGYIDSATYDTASFDTSGQTTSPQGLAFSPDGLGMYVVGTGGVVYQYTMTVAWGLSTATYASKTLSVATELTTTGSDLVFDDTGSNLYVTSSTNNIVAQYSMTTPYDLSTGSYASKQGAYADVAYCRSMVLSSDLDEAFFYCSTADTLYQYPVATPGDISTISYGEKSSIVDFGWGNPVFMKANATGDIWYVMDPDDDTIYQLAMSTDWDVSTLWQDTKEVDASDAISGTGLVGMAFNPDGEEVFLTDVTDGYVRMLDMEVPWRIASAYYGAKEYDVSSECDDLEGIRFSTDGVYMFVCDGTTDTIYRYSLRVPWVVITAEYGGHSFGPVSGNLKGCWFNPTGTTVYYLYDSLGTNYVGSTPLSTAWDLGTAGFGANVVVTPPTSAAKNLAFSADGTAMYVVTDTTVYQHDLSIAWSITTASYSGHSLTKSGAIFGSILFDSTGSYAYIGQVNGSIEKYSLTSAWSLAAYTYISGIAIPEIVRGMAYDSTGDTVYFASASISLGGDVVEYSLNAAWDIVSPVSRNYPEFDVSAQDATPNGVAFNDDGTKMYVAGASTKYVYQYPLSSAYDLTSATAVGVVSLDVSYLTTVPQGICFSPDGTEMFVVRVGTTATLARYTLSTPWDLSTASYVSMFDMSSEDTDMYNLVFTDDGMRFIICGQDNDYAYQYDLTTAWDITTASYGSEYFDLSSYTMAPSGIALDPGGSTLFIAEGMDSKIFEFVLDTESELILKGPGSDGTDDVYIGFRTYTDVTNGRFGLYAEGYTGYESAQTFWLQPGSMYQVSQTYRPLYRLVNNNSYEYWLYISGRSIVTVARPNMRYEVGYSGLYYSNDSPLSPVTGNPYPMYVGASSLSQIISEHLGACFYNGYPGESASNAYLRYTTWLSIGDHPDTGRVSVWPWNVQYDSSDLTELGPILKPDESSVYDLMAATLITDGKVFGQLEGMYFIPPFGVSAEDTVTVGTDVYDVFPAETLQLYCAIKR